MADVVLHNSAAARSYPLTCWMNTYTGIAVCSTVLDQEVVRLHVQAMIKFRAPVPMQVHLSTVKIRCDRIDPTHE